MVDKPPDRQCQCMGCKQKPEANSPFCAYHTKNKCKGSKLSGYEPSFMDGMEYYTSDYSIQNSHNCLAYALGVRDPKKIKMCRDFNKCGFHVPGKDSYGPFQKDTGKTCAEIIARTWSSVPEAIPTTFTAKCPKKTRKIAIVTDEKQDMHYYRQGSNGYWDHKPGSRKPTDKDSDGILIWNPELASRYYPREKSDELPLDYKNFCGYMCVPTKNIKLSGGSRSSKTRRRKDYRKSIRRNRTSS
jgi:hypothetical protein